MTTKNKLKKYSDWLQEGKEKGYHDYWKEMTRIALMNEERERVREVLEGLKIDAYHVRIGGWKGTINQLTERWNEDVFVESIQNTRNEVLRQVSIDLLQALTQDK